MSFDARGPGTPASAWRERFGADPVPPLDLGDLGALLVIAPHPDDETLGAGGLIALAAERGAAVRVVVATDGAASHPGSRGHDGVALAARRAEEARAAVGELAPDARLDLLGLPDGGVLERRDELARLLGEILDETIAVHPDARIVAPWVGDGHRDHRVVGEVVEELAAARGRDVLAYPIWMWHWAHPGDPDGVGGPEIGGRRFVALDLPAHIAERKRRAITAHASQIAPLSADPGDEALLAPGVLEHFSGPTEHYLAVRSHEDGQPGPQPADEATPASYFDDKYARSDDPWGFTTRWYERRKRLATLAALPAEWYGRALEIGAAVGVLTADLAERCDEVVGLELAPAAVAIARRRLSDIPHAEVRQGDVTGELPAGPFDLVVVSEVGYYLDEAALVELVPRLVDLLGPDGTLLACHWRHPVDEYPLSGDRVHELVARHAGLTRTVRHVEADFVLDVLQRDGRSVAERTGLR